MDLNNFHEFPNGIQQKILPMVTFLSAIDKLNQIFSNLDDSLYINILIIHELC